jgi:hypothetical protein
MAVAVSAEQQADTFVRSPHKLDAARRLAACGLTQRAIARTLGVSVSSVGNYLRARSCPECGGPVTNPLAVRCRDCTAHEPTIARAWTRDRV